MPCIPSFFPSRLNPSSPLLGGFHELFARSRRAFRQDRTYRRARDLALSSLVCTSRHTITGLLCTQGSQFSDWSAAYRLFKRRRFDGPALFRPVLEGVLALYPKGRPLCVSLDTTLLGKTGRKVAGARWRRDPLGPPFQVNLVWSQRFLQTSAIVPESFDKPSRARALPIDLRHCPGVKTRPPRKANAMGTVT